ncbi:DUF3089 domain-containing protein [Flavihumibacter rivuli]|uniref:DUF3089 domain-containing protein n=1 Tax=Flavihumibacter rivuli TaxID=2838156 RepID=UPI001BDF0107|nr:DUF3089 domain-containing protein [Flavihumibacter rivuli]ULQ55713.1 DUF3089 domain-containing protein [Flavihumibacter rivuli]
MKLTKSLYLSLLPLIGGLLLSACSSGPRLSVPVNNDIEPAPDYSQIAYWAAHPGKQDPSDLVPAALQKNYVKDSSVDVFFIYPTIYTHKKAKRWNAAIDDAELNNKIDGSSIKYQASAFNECNVFTPRYRQAHIQSYYDKDTSQALKAFDIAYQDVKAAFEYYLANENKGKPFVIASHSQGTTHSKRLIRELVEGKPLQKQLVAAYIIGIQVEPDYFTSLQPCRDSTATGCYVAWRTFRRDYEPDYKPSSRRSVVVNPLNWKTDTSYASVGMHKGAILRNFDKLVPAVSDAQVYKDLLWISRPKFPGSWLYTSRNYHIGDINLFYMNIRENLSVRIKSYKNQR